ncbi:MAG: IS30 family transposase [Candidatus Pacebacteria bacterium]|nr:IS30 family transposase [Candidatus Paceibacterota bacterium]
MSYIHITREDRISLVTLRRVNTSIADIAKILNKNRSSIYRELSRNKTNNKSGYDIREAEVLAKERRIKANKRFKKIENNTKLRNQVISKIKIYWSPEEISGRLKLEGIDIGKDSIYKYIYNNRKDLIKYLRYGKKYNHKRRKGTKIREKLREEEKKIRIDKRPDIINNRERIGDFEGDLIVFGNTKKHPPILTLNERYSGYLKIDILKDKTANITQEAIVKKLKEIPKKKRLSLTLDNGSEFSYHDIVKRKAKVEVYFAFPYHS